jgi:hypothetical protein
MRPLAAILRDGARAHQECLIERDNQIDRDWAAFRARHEERRQAKIAASWDQILADVAAETDKAPAADEDDNEPRQPRYAPHPEQLKPGKRKRRRRFGGSFEPVNSAIEQGWDVALAEVAAQEPAPGASMPAASERVIAQSSDRAGGAAGGRDAVRGRSPAARTGEALERLWHSMFSD